MTTLPYPDLATICQRYASGVDAVEMAGATGTVWIASVTERDAVPVPEMAAEIRAKKQAIDFPYLSDNLPELIHESREGLARVQSTMINVKHFSHASSGEKYAR